MPVIIIISELDSDDARYEWVDLMPEMIEEE